MNKTCYKCGKLIWNFKGVNKTGYDDWCHCTHVADIGHEDVSVKPLELRNFELLRSEKLEKVKSRLQPYLVQELTDLRRNLYKGYYYDDRRIKNIEGIDELVNNKTFNEFIDKLLDDLGAAIIEQEEDLEKVSNRLDGFIECVYLMGSEV